MDDRGHGAGHGTYLDTSLTSLLPDTCVRYRYVARANDSSQTVFADNWTVYADSDSPQVGVGLYPAEQLNAPVYVSGGWWDLTVGTHVVTYDGPGANDGTLTCPIPYPFQFNCGLWTPPTPGAYDVSATVTDPWGRATTETRTFTYDLTDPTGAFDAFADGVNPAASHAVGSTLYIRAASAGSVTVEVDAQDDDAVASVASPIPTAPARAGR